MLTENNEADAIRFLYNGEYGVITDANNLYFMRERYYNVDSKRFTSEDVIVGSISDSASLNRYAYVQGNPITYVDPLGLSPYSILSSLGHSLFNAAGFIPGIGELFDCVNALWYAAEGNSEDAISSFVSALPFVGSVAGNSMKWLSKGSKWATKASKYVDATCNIIAGTSTLYRSSDSAYKRVEYLYDNYIKTGKKFDGRAAREILGLALDITSSVLAGKQMKSGIGGFCKQAKEDWQLRKALDGYSVADGKKPSLKMNLQLFASNRSKGGSSTYIPRDADGNPIPLNKQRVNGQDIPLAETAAQGRPHTVLGGKVSSETGEVYRQSATFPAGTWPTANGQNVPWSEVHWTDHGAPHHHTNPHQHIFEYRPDKGGWIRSEPTIFEP